MEFVWTRGTVAVRLSENATGRPQGSILVASHRPSVQKAIALQLVEWGYRVRRCPALDQLENTIDYTETEAIVLCVESLRDKRRLAAHAKASARHIPIILVVGDPAREEAVEALRSGFFDYVVIEEIQIIRQLVLGAPPTETPDPLRGALAKAVNHARLMAYSRQLTGQLEVANSSLAAEREELRDTLQRLKIAQKQLLRTQKSAGLSVVSHGVGNAINNPLAIIGSNLDLIRHWYNGSGASSLDHPLTEELTEIINECGLGLDRIKTTVASLMQFAHRTDVSLEAVDLATLLHNIPPFLAHQWASSVSFTLECALDSPVLANRYLLRQALVCIIENAAEANAIAGKTDAISLRATAEGELASIQIEDRGDGVDADHQETMFDPFFTTRLERNAEGLGLSLALEIVQQMNGTVEVQSAIGAGTCVTIKIPLAPAATLAMQQTPNIEG